VQEDKPFLRVLEFRSFEEGGVVFAVAGELDLATVDHLTRALHGVWHRAEIVTIDLRRVSFIDCLGLRALLELSAEGTDRGCRVEFIQGPRPVQRVFELTGSLQQLSFVDAASPPVAATPA
jgi:anti-sigma B factor antagonist